MTTEKKAPGRPTTGRRMEKRLTIAIPEEMLVDLEKEAQEDGRTVAAYVREVLKRRAKK